MLTLAQNLGLLSVAFGAIPSFAQATSLCDVSKNPSAYNGKRITIHAEFMSDHIERSVLINKDCPAQGILPYLKDHAIGSAAFTDATSIRPSAHLKERLTATFTGTFHFAEKPEMCMFMNKELCRRSIEIDRIDDLKLTMTPTQ